MKFRLLFTTAALATVLAATSPARADEKGLGFTVGNIAITKHIPSGNMSLSNKAAQKTVEALDLRVTGNEPVFTVTGQIFCKSGARLVEAQVILGSVFLHNGQPMALVKHGESPKLTSIAGRSDADVEIPAMLSVQRQATDAAVDLTFNPARTFLKKVDDFVAKGGSAASYLQSDQAFDMPVDVSLVGWCKMPDNADSVLAGKTYAGFATRQVPVTILYTGDPKIVDGAGVRAVAGTGLTTKEEATPQVRRPDAPPPPRRKEKPRRDN